MEGKRMDDKRILGGADKPSLVLKHYPLPPSVNEAYRNVPGVGRVKSSVYKKFELEVGEWSLTYRKALLEAFTALIKGDWMGYSVFEIDFFFIVARHRLWTKKGEPKRFDADSRIKAGQDVFCKVLGMDDKYFWSTRGCKIEGEREGCILVISPHEPLNAFELEEVLGGSQSISQMHLS